MPKIAEKLQNWLPKRVSTKSFGVLYEKNIRMSFTIGENYDFIKVEAQIAGLKEKQERYLYGLSFSQINDEDRDKISEYINANCYDQFKSKWWAM